MSEVHRHILLLFSIPIYAVLIPLEIVLNHTHGWRFYSLRETLTNIYLNVLNVGFDLLLRGVAFGVLVWASAFSVDLHLSLPVYWLMLFLLEDLLFYTEHYVDHHVRLFWAVHVTHHSSEEFNLTTGFRSSVFMPFYRYLYFIPLALLGFAPLDIFFMYAITQTYGILVHTQAIKKLPRWIEAVFVTPSHHRVHHASNIPYLDKNMGMVLIIWDRLFGTFTEELPDEPPRFGLVTPLQTPDPVHIVTHEWKAIARDLKKDKRLSTRLNYLFRPPGWSHDGSTMTSVELQNELKKARAQQAPPAKSSAAPELRFKLKQAEEVL